MQIRVPAGTPRRFTHGASLITGDKRLTHTFPVVPVGAFFSTGEGYRRGEEEEARA